MTDSRHSDNFRRGDPAARSTSKDKPAATTKSVDNDSQAQRAESERSFAMGGDAPETGPPAQPDVRPTPLLDSALARLARPDRPSPFGVAHFPPLPLPPHPK